MHSEELDEVYSPCSGEYCEHGQIKKVTSDGLAQSV
jgi:hypothetical protein